MNYIYSTRGQGINVPAGLVWTVTVNAEDVPCHRVINLLSLLQAPDFEAVACEHDVSDSPTWDSPKTVEASSRPRIGKIEQG